MTIAASPPGALDIRPGRLDSDTLKANFADLHAPLTLHEARVEAERAGAAKRIGREIGPGVVFRPVDSVGVGGEGRDPRLSVEREGEAQEELGVAAATALASDGHRGFAA